LELEKYSTAVATIQEIRWKDEGIMGKPEGRTKVGRSRLRCLEDAENDL
jgi:hypothetical protein